MSKYILIPVLFLLISCASVSKQTINSDPTKPSEQTALQKTGTAIKDAASWLLEDGLPIFIDTAIWNIK